MKASIVRAAALGCLASLASVTSGCGPKAPPGPCSTEGQAVLLDDQVQGERVGDLVEPYAGNYSGTLSYSGGESTGLTLGVALNNEECHLSRVWQCSALAMTCYPTLHVRTEDGVFDYDIAASLSDVFFLDPIPGFIYDSVLSCPAFIPPQWEALTAHVPIDVSRYDSPSLRLDFDWPPRESPRSGKLTFSGQVSGTNLADEIVVASFVFETD